MKQKSKNVVIIPAYNEALHIRSITKAVLQQKMAVIVVDDGSSDNTAKKLQGLKIVYLRHKANLGKGAAMITGVKAAINLGFERFIFMDGDGQHLSGDLDKFTTALEKYDVVFGIRSFNNDVPLIRFLGNKLASLFISFLFGIYISDLICGFRGLSKKAFLRMNLQSRGYEIETEMVIKTRKQNLKYCQLPVQTLYYDKFKGVTILDAVGILFNVLSWKLK